jgi:nitroreductase/dihydropteridine reductase
MSLIEKLQWRAAVKKFDTAKKLTAAQLDGLLSTIQLAPSSYGLQSYKVIVVQDAETKANCGPRVMIKHKLQSHPLCLFLHH